MYVMTNSGKLLADELTEWLLQAGFIQSQFHMSIYYKYAPDGSKTFVVYYVDDFSIGILLKFLENGLWIL